MEASGERNSSSSGSNNDKRRGEKRKIGRQVTFQTSMAMAAAAAEKVSGHPRKRLHPNTNITLHDNRSSGYGWTLDGWLCEEHVMESGRVYRYYYDPIGTLYKTRQEVYAAWEKNDLYVLDK